MWGVYDDYGNIRYGEHVAGYTRAAPNDSVRLSVVSDSAAVLSLFNSRNPAYTECAVFDSLANRYRSGTGDTIAGEYWGQVSEWDGITFPVYTPNSLMSVSVLVRNCDSLVTDSACTDCTWVYAQVPGMTHTSVIDSVRLRIRLTPLNNPWYTFFAVQDSISGRFVDAAEKRLRSPVVTPDSAWAFGRFSDWGGEEGIAVSVAPGESCHFRAYAKDGMSNP